MPTPRILIVEDEPDGQELVAALLSDFDIAIDAAATAEEAIDLLSEHDYTGVIIDIMLPGMDGWELLKAIRNEPRLAELPCVAITALHSSAVRQHASQAGFDAYFPKPLDDVTFAQELSAVIANR